MIQRFGAYIIVDLGIRQSFVIDLEFLTDRPEQWHKSLAAIEVAGLAVRVPDAVEEDYWSKLERGEVTIDEKETAYTRLYNWRRPLYASIFFS